MSSLLEFKSIPAQVKDVDTKTRVVSGYFSNFGNVDHDNDIILPGAFAKSIRDRGPQGANKILFLGFHDWQKILGKPSVLTEDAKGLYFESTIADTSYGRDLMVLYEEGLVNEHSVGFQTVRSKDSGNGVRELQELYLWEGSAVAMGANDQTPFTGFKSRTMEDNDKNLKSIVKLLRSGTLTDETFIQLEIALKQLQLEAYEIGQKNAPVIEQPLASTDLNDTPQPSESEALINYLKDFTIN